MLAVTGKYYQSIRPEQIAKLYGPCTFDAGLYLVRVTSDVISRGSKRRYVRTSELGRVLWP